MKTRPLKYSLRIHQSPGLIGPAPALGLAVTLLVSATSPAQPVNDNGATPTVLTGFSFEDTQNWEFKPAPNGDPGLDKIRVDPDDGNLWYVGSTDNGLYVTRDGGNTWEQHLKGMSWGVFIDPTNPSRVYAGSSALFSYNDLYRSEDKGHTWFLMKAFPVDQTIYSILVSSVDGAVWVGMHWVASDSPNGMYKSSDHGQSWSFYPFNLAPLPYDQQTRLIIWDIAEDPVHGILYASTEVGSKPPCTPFCYDPPMLRSMDGGQTWQDVSGSPGSPGSLSWHATRLQVHPLTQQVYFQTEGGAVYTSTDFGGSWELTGAASYNYCWDLLIDRNFPTRFFGGGLDAQVRLSTDGAQSFSSIGPKELVGQNGIFHVALNGTSTRLFASYFSGPSQPGGVYVTDLAAANRPPVARCQDLVLKAGSACTATGSVDDGSSDPDNDPITITQDPPGPYPLGQTPVTLTVTDSQGASSQCAALVTVVDETPPGISCPPNQVANATSPSGATVFYPGATATDNCGAPSIRYSQNSGTLFSIGDTLVVVTAQDGATNQIDCNFTVHVKGAAEQLQELITKVSGLTVVKPGIRNALVVKVQVALAAVKAGALSTAVPRLDAFINLVWAQRSKELPTATADDLIADTMRIKAVLGSP